MRFVEHPRAVAFAAVASLLAGCAGGPGEREPVGDQSSADTSQCLPDAGGVFPEGVDVSAGQGTAIDWARAKDAGITWAVMKATQGVSYVDDSFAVNQANAKDAGVARAAYHFFDPTADGTTQAQSFLKVLGPLDAEDLSPMLDIECPDGDATCLGYAGGSGDADAGAIRTRMNDWLADVEAETGRKPVIYSFGSYFAGNAISTTGLSAYPFWLAAPDDTRCISVPAPWTSAAIWQWSFTGTVAGIPSEVDRDRILGPIEELTGWPAIKHDSRADVNGDGRADVCGRDASGVVCALAAGAGFGAPFAGPAWSDAEGWSPSRYASTVQFGDVDGDGRSDACGRGIAGITCVLSAGTSFGATLTGPAWSDAAGWSRPEYYATVQLADVNGDGKSDVCARGASGITCALATGAGFGAPFAGPAWSDAAGWNVPNRYRTIRFADIDGDGAADVCGRSSDGLHCARSTGSGFGPDIVGPTWSDAAGWGRAAYASTIALVDVSGDGKSDACARAAAGIVCALSTGTGFAPTFAGPSWSDAAGWSLPMRYATILFPDLNGDGARDVCGRAASGMTCALATSGAFGVPFAGPAWSDAAGWSEPRYYGTIGAGDIDADGKDDLCARSASGVACTLSAGASFGATVTGPSWSDAAWGVAPYWATMATVGRAGHASDAGPPLDAGSPGETIDGAVAISASARASASAGCSCRAAGPRSSSGAPGFGLAVAVWALERRRRRCQSRPPSAKSARTRAA